MPQKEFSNELPEMKLNSTTSFEWTCNNAVCNYQKLINAISLIYAGPDVALIEKNIPYVLEKVARFTKADHIAVSSCTSSYKTLHAYYEWNGPEVEFLNGNSGKVTTANLLKIYYPLHVKGKDIYISSYRKAGTEHDPLTRLIQLNGIKSLISLPLSYNNSLVGCLELYYMNTETDFHERELTLLRHFAQLQSFVNQRIQHLQKWMSDADTFVNRQRGYELELKKAMENAESAKKIKDTFFVNLSHEIRTPLNIIAGMHRELIREKLNSRQMHFLQQSYTASRLLLNLFNNVMDINDMETGAFHLVQKDFNLRQLMMEVKEMLDGKAEEKKAIDFQMILPDSLYPVYKGDAQRLQQILVKLISNAFKFTNEGTIRFEVNIRRKTPGFHELLFEISDTGIGMSKEFVEKVFYWFTQENDSLDRIHEGAGLGLYICYRLAIYMGGSIQVESIQGAGTQFQLTLPLQLGDEAALKSQLSNAAAYNFSQLKILLVEDNDTNRFIARQTLNRTGCKISEATNGLEAVEQLRNQNFDLILMDIQMPVMNGMKATEIIRKELKLYTPIIAFTANAVESEIAKYLSYGMEDYIVKPYREIELYEKIEKHTRNQAEVSKMETKHEKLYDLSYLNELSQGDMDFTRQIIETFLEMAAQSVEQLRKALETNDLASIRKIAHKIKPTLANFQIFSIKGLIDNLNQTDLTTLKTDQLSRDVEKVIEVLTIIQKQLSEEIN